MESIEGVRLQKAFKGIIKSVDEKNYVVDAIVSTPDVDRDQERILPDAFSKRLGIYKQHPVLLTSHNYREIRAQIGEATEVKITPEGLNAKFKYYVGAGNPDADWAFFLASKGMAAFSVGFMAHKWEDKTPSEADASRRVFTDVELVEISQVLVPSNRSALARMAMAEGCENPDGELEKELAGLVLKGDLHLKPEPDVTDNYIRIRVRDPGDFTEGSFRTVTISAEKGIKAVMGKLKKAPEGREGSMVAQSFLFDKEKWSVAEAQKWVKEHENKQWILVGLFAEFAITIQEIENYINLDGSDRPNYIDVVLGSPGKSQGDEPTKPQIENSDTEEIKKLITNTFKGS